MYSCERYNLPFDWGHSKPIVEWFQDPILVHNCQCKCWKIAFYILYMKKKSWMKMQFVNFKMKKLEKVKIKIFILFNLILHFFIILNESKRVSFIVLSCFLKEMIVVLSFFFLSFSLISSIFLFFIFILLIYLHFLIKLQYIPLKVCCFLNSYLLDKFFILFFSI